MEKGTVIRINNAHKRPGFRGAFVLITKEMDNHIEGIIHQIIDDDKSRERIVRLMKYECTIVGHVQDRVTAVAD